MAELGTSVEPGIVTDVSSATTVSTDGASISDVGIVGQADLGSGTDQGSATPNEVYAVTRSTDARKWFGKDSLLTEAVTDALNEEALPVFAVATSEVTVTGEDLSGLSSTSGTLVNAPVSEDPADVDFTIDGVAKSEVVVYDDPSTYSPGTDEVYYNPVTGDFELDAAPADTDSTNDTVDYEYFDYPTAHQALVDGAAEVIDFFVCLSENTAAKNDAQTKLGNMEQEYNFALGIVGAGARITISSYSSQFDDSRMQVVYPSRDASDKSILGAFAGRRAALGVTTTPINKRLKSEKKLAVSLNTQERGDLIQKYVVPLDQEARGARIADDVNTVSDSNTEESNIRYGFTRLVIDYAIKTVHKNERPFVGRLNSKAVRNTLQGLLVSELKPLEKGGSVVGYSISIRKVDATTATVEMGIETAKPLRFIENDIAVGGVQ